MKYVLLDTNIILDMVIDRRNQINNHFLDKFLKLLGYDEIKLILPEIVKAETMRHLEREFQKIESNFEKELDNIKNLYGVSTLKVQGFDVSSYKKEARKSLNDALEEFRKNKALYKKDIFDTIEQLFDHSNCIVLDDTVLIDRVVKRKFYKRAPFHKVEKDSNGDGIIAETLINLRDEITFKDDEDEIYFVTGNFKDFSDPNDMNY